MKIKTYHISAFTNQFFSGNPAMVCILEKPLSDASMQKIATENNLPATSFLIAHKEHFSIRWFAPECELPLCGHGTLAAGYVIFNMLKSTLEIVRLDSPVGSFFIRNQNNVISFDFPVKNMEHISTIPPLEQALGKLPIEVYQHKNERCFVVFKDENDIRQLSPNMKILEKLNYRGFIFTAPSKQSDFVSRVFYPGTLISEDFVTGSSHCLLIPYWANRLNKNTLLSHQISSRGGELLCELQGNRVIMGGRATLYAQGEIVLYESQSRELINSSPRFFRTPSAANDGMQNNGRILLKSHL